MTIYITELITGPAGNRRPFYLGERMKSNLLINYSFLGLGILFGIIMVFPTNSRDNEIRARAAVAVYEGRITCEKALDQWGCSIPND
ncbi:hypothetical protein BVE49_20940 [Salmonella enterica]|nr:hypothetical protein [Salmonella enterica]